MIIKMDSVKFNEAMLRAEAKLKSLTAEMRTIVKENKMAMRHRIKMMQDSAADGEVNPSYTNFMTKIPCDIKQVAGGERHFGKQLQAETTIVIHTRYYPGFLPNMRAVNEVTGDVYEIVKILDPDMRSRKQMIEAKEVVV